MARPKLQEHERRSASLPPVSVTLAERLHCEEQASNAGLSLTEYMRTLALHETVKPRQSKVEASLLMELNRIGVNLNQLTHSANIGRTSEAKLNNTIAELSALIEDVSARI